MLVQRSHALLHDDIVTAVYNMAAVDFSSFYDEFLRHFLQSTANVDCQHTAQLLALFHAEEASLLVISAAKTMVTCKIKHLQNVLMFYFIYNQCKTFAKHTFAKMFYRWLHVK